MKIDLIVLNEFIFKYLMFIDKFKIKSVNYVVFHCLQYKLNMYNTTAGDYCVGVIPDPIPNSEVKPFCADGTLS